MRTMHTPVEIAIGNVMLMLDRHGSHTTLRVKNTTQVPLRGVYLTLRTSPEVGANPAQFSFGTIAASAAADPQQVELRFAPGVQQAVPEFAYPVYVLEFEVIITSPKDRMTGAFHISFA